MELNSQSIEEGRILSFDKPLYWTSFDLVKKIKYTIINNLGLKKIKVGHAGTLDPLATGLLIICTGRATKKISEIQGQAKEYVATIRVGQTTPSFDLETNVDAEYPWSHITEESVSETIKEFIGEQMQVPPVYSAKLVDGERAYNLARRGIERKMEPVAVVFHSIELTKFALPEIEFRIKCSKGTYIRSFAHDFGKALKSGAFLSALRRTAIGEQRVENALTHENFSELLAILKQN